MTVDKGKELLRIYLPKLFLLFFVIRIPVYYAAHPAIAEGICENMIQLVGVGKLSFWTYIWGGGVFSPVIRAESMLSIVLESVLIVLFYGALILEWVRYRRIVPLANVSYTLRFLWGVLGSGLILYSYYGVIAILVAGIVRELLLSKREDFVFLFARVDKAALLAILLGGGAYLSAVFLLAWNGKMPDAELMNLLMYHGTYSFFGAVLTECLLPGLLISLAAYCWYPLGGVMLVAYTVCSFVCGFSWWWVLTVALLAMSFFGTILPNYQKWSYLSSYELFCVLILPLGAAALLKKVPCRKIIERVIRILILPVLLVLYLWQGAAMMTVWQPEFMEKNFSGWYPALSERFLAGDTAATADFAWYGTLLLTLVTAFVLRYCFQMHLLSRIWTTAWCGFYGVVVLSKAFLPILSRIGGSFKLLYDWLIEKRPIGELVQFTCEPVEYLSWFMLLLSAWMLYLVWSEENWVWNFFDGGCGFPVINSVLLAACSGALVYLATAVVIAAVTVLPFSLLAFGVVFAVYSFSSSHDWIVEYLPPKALVADLRALGFTRKDRHIENAAFYLAKKYLEKGMDEEEIGRRFSRLTRSIFLK